ncbi:MAG: GIY-YIG nuclease family protein [Candidatus Moranbacteria bacterium]|nr:GIY-YIG nuclease family protein [Candidatus Moranbacteria bacterium]
MYHCYVLRSLRNGRYYIGSCEDIDIRLNRHNGSMVKSTKAFTPWELLASESFQTRPEAAARERQLKSWKSRSKVEEYIAKRNRESSVDCGGPLA